MPNPAIESLRTFAEQHGELQFAHLCTAALAGKEWAVDRLAPALAEMPLWPNNMQHELTLLKVIDETDTARPDGAIARSIAI